MGQLAKSAQGGYLYLFNTEAGLIKQNKAREWNNGVFYFFKGLWLGCGVPLRRPIGLNSK